MTAEAGRKKSRLFLDSYSAPRSSLEIDTNRSALCCGGGVPTQGTPHRLRMLCGAALISPDYSALKAVVYPRTQCNQATKASCSRRPAFLRPLLKDRQAASLPGRQDRPAAKVARLSAPLAFRPDKKGPKMLGDATTLQQGFLGARH